MTERHYQWARSLDVPGFCVFSGHASPYLQGTGCRVYAHEHPGGMMVMFDFAEMWLTKIEKDDIRNYALELNGNPYFDNGYILVPRERAIDMILFLSPFVTMTITGPN